jgi:hypothetical protein
MTTCRKSGDIASRLLNISRHLHAPNASPPGEIATIIHYIVKLHTSQSQCGMGVMRNAYTMLVGRSERNKRVEDIFINDSIILQYVLGRTNHLLSFVRHGPHRKRKYVCGRETDGTVPSNGKVWDIGTQHGDLII